MPPSEREEQLRHLVEYGADTLWQPIVKAILDMFQKFEKDSHESNVGLLVTERNYFHDFYLYFLEPAFPKGIVRHEDVLTGTALKKMIGGVKEKVIFVEQGIDWHADKRAGMKSRANSVRDLLEAARRGGKFLILCGYSSNMNRFRALLSLAFADEKPEIEGLVLKPLS